MVLQYLYYTKQSLSEQVAAAFAQHDQSQRDLTIHAINLEKANNLILEKQKALEEALVFLFIPMFTVLSFNI